MTVVTLRYGRGTYKKGGWFLYDIGDKPVFRKTRKGVIYFSGSCIPIADIEASPVGCYLYEYKGDQVAVIKFGSDGKCPS